MRIKTTTGHVIYRPLNYTFEVVQLGGSGVQKYDTVSSAYIPDREIAPLVLQPQLTIKDPDGQIPIGIYTHHMANVTWKLTLKSGETMTDLSAGDGYGVDNATKALTFSRNLTPAESVEVTFDADYLDKRRNDVTHFHWSCLLITEAQTNTNVTLDTGRWPSKVNLSPFKKWGIITIPVQLLYGDSEVPDSQAAYQWQRFDSSSKQWKTDIDDFPWYVSGKDGKELCIEQDYVQDILLRVKAVAFGNENTTQYFCIRLRRWYGQYEEDVDILTGRYIFPDTTKVVLEAHVVNRQGIISNPERYFDMELFFGVGEDIESVGYGTKAEINRHDLQTGAPTAGVLCRERSAYLPLDAGNGNLTDGEKVICLQIPISTKS